MTDIDLERRIRPATAEERKQSLSAGHEGHINVDGRRCYVED